MKGAVFDSASAIVKNEIRCRSALDGAGKSIDVFSLQDRESVAGRTFHCLGWRTRIEDDTPIVPRAAAELVCEEASLWLGEPFPRAWVAELAEHANVVYQHNARFRRLLRKRGNIWLMAFMRHWLCGLLDSRRPDLCQRLPGSYAVGQDLPA